MDRMDAGFWILDPGCWTPMEKRSKRAEGIFSRRAAVNAEGKIRNDGIVEIVETVQVVQREEDGGKDGEPGKESRNTALELVEFG